MKKVFLQLMWLLCVVSITQAALISETVDGSSWSGNVRLDQTEIKARIHSTFIEIEEEAVLTPIVKYTGFNPPVNQQYNLRISGKVTIPKNAVVTGALLWENGKMLKAQLKHNHDIDNQFDTISTQNSRGKFELDGTETTSLKISYIQGSDFSDVDTLEIAIGQVRWKDNRRIRVHYIVPMRYYDNTVPQMLISRIFAPVCSEIPSEYKLNLLPSETVTETKLSRNNKTITYQLPTTVMDELSEEAYAIRKIGDDKKGLMLISSFPKDTPNSLTGEFMHIWSQIPDSLFLAAGLKREVVFLWRWENENSLVNWDTTTNNKHLTKYGKAAVRQAKGIRNAAHRLMYSKAGVAMYHDRSKDKYGNDRDSVFQMAYKNSTEASTFIDYLNLLTENNGEYLLAEIKGKIVSDEGGGDTLTADELDSICEEGAADFEMAIDTIYNLFSKDEKLIKHIVLISAGKRKTNKNKIKINELKAVLDGVTFSGLGQDETFPTGYWPGVDIDNIIDNNKLINGEDYNGLYLPRSKVASFLVQFKNGKKNITKTIIGDKGVDKTVFYDNIYYTSHTSSTWNDTLFWSAQDSLGNTLAQFQQVPHKISVQSDTAVAMLWGGSSAEPESDIYQSSDSTSIGYILGFVDQDYGLIAHSGDSLSSDKQKLIENGGDIEYIQIDEKHPETDILTSNQKKLSIGLHAVQTIHQMTVFDLYIGDARNATLKIYDLKGRLLMEFTKEMLQNKSQIFWNGSMRNGSIVSSGMYLAVATIGNKVQTVKFVR